MSTEHLEPQLTNILDNGPSFVNAEPKELPKRCLLSKASLQRATDRLKEEHIPESALNELTGGITRIIEECEKVGAKILNSKKLSYKKPPENIVITSTDKTKRLVALDSACYKDMVQKSTVDTGNYQSLKKSNLPRTEQIKFNGKLNNIANKYKYSNPTLHKQLKSTVCSEPLPCSVYCLPKDHKEGQLKGRPIHAATDTPATCLAKYLSKPLNTLLQHVPAHLKNTREFVDHLMTIEGETVHQFCSLDVSNLYGSIPLEDINTKTLGVFTVVRKFFSKYKTDCQLWALSDEDFEALIRLCISSDTVLIGGKAYKQQSGLAMGNNLAPTLAIIYMNEIDSLIIEKTNGRVSLKRYIDDYFASLFSKEITAEELLKIANDQNDAIKFTLELPNNNQLPFLDTLVTFNSDTKTFSTCLYRKPIHSGCIIPWDSHGSIASKRAILIGEIKRAIYCSSNQQARRKSFNIVTELFLNNGYPREMIKTTIRNTLRITTTTLNENDEQQKTIYIRMPFINEDFKRRALGVVRRSGIANIKIYFENGRPLAKVFAPPRNKPNCPDKCVTCKLASKRNQCLTKNVVYQITCTTCDIIYIGETGRTIGQRIKEHLAMDKQTVYRHLISHNQRPEDAKITWKLLHTQIRNQEERRYIEAVEIRNNADKVMNGCTGRTLLYN